MEIQMREVPVIAPIPKSGYWITMDDVIVTVNFRDRKYSYVVPVGFETDFASVPRALWWFISPTDYPALRASLLHDYLYRVGSCTREWADRLFYQKLIEDGMPKWKAWLMYMAVRLFGGKVWERYRDDSQE